jgi:hypothetical protein
MDGASASILSLSIIHYHPERDEPILKKHAPLHNGRKFIVETKSSGANVLLKKISAPLQRIIHSARSLGFEYVMFSPQGAKMDHFFPAFPEAWEDVEEETREYQVVGEVGLEAETPEEAAEEFVRKVQGGEIVVTVRNMNTDAIADIFLGSMDVTDGPNEEIDQKQEPPTDEQSSDEQSSEDEQS